LLNIISGTLSTGAPPVSPTSYESIATVTVGSGGSSTITFSSIPSTWTHLQLRTIAAHSTSEGYFKIRFNGDSGANYSWHELQGTGSSVSAGGGGGKTFVLVDQAFGAGSYFGAAVIDILDYKNTNKYKTVRALSGVDENGTGYIVFNSSAWYDLTAISSIEITFTSSPISQYSSFALYGIKG